MPATPHADDLVLLSVVVPVRDRVERLPRALASALGPSGLLREVIVVDDGSRDGTAAWLAAQDDPRLRWLHQQPAGAAAARNRGAAQARGRYLFFLDSDDEALPEAWGRLAAAIDGGDPGLVCAGALVRPPAGSPGEDEAVSPTLWTGPFGGVRVSYLAGSFAVRRDVFAAVGGYCEELAYAENTELVFRVVAECRRRGLEVAAIDEPLTVYRQEVRAPSRERTEAQLAASEYFLRRHRTVLDEIPALAAQIAANAGVRAARLGEYGRARRHFLFAVRRAPWRWRNYARAVAAGLPPLRRRLWSRV